ncbi:MAG: tetratricopeptide repeat protein [Gammaproteobacteria bacterium]
MKLRKDNEADSPATDAPAVPTTPDSPAAAAPAAPATPDSSATAAPATPAAKNDEPHAPRNMDAIGDPAAADSAAANADSDSPEGEEEEELTAKPMPVFVQVLLRIVSHRATWITAGVAALGVVGYYAAVFVYSVFLLSAGSAAMDDGNYPEVVRRVTTYEDFSGRNDESLLLLSRAAMYLGDYNGLDTLLADYDDDEVELRYLRIIGRHYEDRKRAAAELAVLDNWAGKDSPLYIAAAQGVFQLLDKEWYAALPHLENVAAAAEPDIFVNVHILELFNLYLDQTDLVLSRELPAPFEFPRDADDRGLGFISSTEAFNNRYYVPLSRSFISKEMRADEVADAYRGLALLSRTQADPENAMQIAADFTAEDSRLSYYIIGYYLMAAGEYERAAAAYRAIPEEEKSVLSAQYEIQARWLAQGGGAPDQATKLLLESAMRKGIPLDPANLSALSNFAYLQYNYGDLDTAKKLINDAVSVESLNKFVVLNRLMIEFAEGTVDHQNARAEIEGLLPQFPQSRMLLHLAVRVETDLKNMAQAINHLYRLRELHSEDPALALEIADRYRYIGRTFLAIQDMKDAARQFPDNAEIAGALALYQAMHGDPGAAKSIAGLPSKSFAAQYARAMTHVQNNEYEKAATAAEAAMAAASPSERAGVAVDLARIYLSAEATERAVLALLAARNAAPDSSRFGLSRSLDALDYRIRAAHGEKAAAEAEAELKRAAGNHDVFAQIDLALALIAMDTPEQGVRALETIRREQHGNIRTPAVFAALITGYEAMGLDDQARETRDKLAVILAGEELDESGGDGETDAPSSGKVFASRADALKAINAAIKRRDYAGAIGLFTDLIEDKDSKVKKPALNFQNRGVLYVKLEQFEEAAEDFATALTMRDQLSPRELDAVHYNYVHALGKAGDFDAMVEEVEERLAVADDAGEEFVHRYAYLRLLAARLVNQGNHQKAAEVYNQIIALRPRDINAYLQLSESERVLENFDAAVSALSKGLEIDSSNLQIHERLLRIYRQLGDAENTQRELKIINDLRSQ